jgi:hypothetical protein
VTACGIQLNVSDGRPLLIDLVSIQSILADLGMGIWPLHLTGVSDEIRALIRRQSLSDEERARLLTHFLLSRERLLEVIAQAGRTPHVSGGGELSTRVMTHGYSYPQLYVVQGDEDFSRFDRFHLNKDDDGTGVDECAQMLSGRGLVVHRRRSDGIVFTLQMDCPNEGTGWLMTHDGAHPHIGSISQAAAGTKILVQAIGPPAWSINYVDE